MELNEEIWGLISSTVGISEDAKKALHAQIMRLIEQSKASPVGRKMGVAVMTQEASLSADKVASDRRNKPLAGDAKPKTL
jgi:hypothetical protein